MEFFFAQESLTAIQWFLRAIFSFLFLILATRLMGERSISQLRLVDFTIALILGNILAQPLADEQLGMKGALITTTTLIGLYLFFVILSLKWGQFRKWFEPSPYPVIKNGEIIYANLAKARITIDHLLSELRKKEIEEVKNVAFAQWEPDGTISFFLSPELRALTPKDMQLFAKPFAFSMVVIKEGRIDLKELQRLGKEQDWLNKEISKRNLQIHEILLATLDMNEELVVYLYERLAE